MAWRWHFYAGLYVVPFLLILSVTGLVMLFDDEIETARYSSILEIQNQSTQTDIRTQVLAVQNAFPTAVVTQFIATKAQSIANRFSIQTQENKQLFVTVDPYTAEVLGTIDRSNSIYNTANKIHSTLLIGNLGDYLIEISASLGILMIISGIYLWLPRDAVSKMGFLKVRTKFGRRVMLRDLHSNTAGVFSVILLLFFISGLSWTGLWGAKIVQAWNSFPSHYVWGEKPASSTRQSLTHADLNHASEEEMPWNLELTPVPESSQKPHDHSKMLHNEMLQKSSQAEPFLASADINMNNIGINKVIELASSLGFKQYRIFFPKTETGVFTITANSMAGDIIDPSNDRTVHVDQYSGEVLMDVTWDQYSNLAKLVALGVTLHQGDMGVINKTVNAMFCMSFILISVLGTIMWWIRRPRDQNSLSPPPRFQSDGVWITGLTALVALSILFPLGGIAIIVIFTLEYLALSKLAKPLNSA